METRVIDTPAAGPIRAQLRDGLIVARGVPYAHAARFEPPVPATRFDAPQDATRQGPAFPQNPGNPDDAAGQFVVGMRQDEDALVLSVTAPAIDEAGAHEPLPVMFWIHGGGYTNGSGEGPEYTPDGLVRRGIVVVSINYRLGICGYLNPDADGPQNLGVMDQITALRWVRDNIAAFGGDPDRITVAGQSAGADAVLALLSIPVAAAMFQRAIVQSAPTGLKTGRTYAKVPEALRAVVRDRLGTGPGAQDAPIADVLAAQQAAVEKAGEFGFASGMPFAPIPGSEPVPVDADTPAAWARVAPAHDLLIGWTADETRAFIPTMPIGVTALRFGAPGRAAAGLVTSAMTRRIFSGPARRTARDWRDAGGRAVTYDFDWHPAGSTLLRACHAIDLPFLFSGDWTAAPMMAGEEPDPALADRMQAAWAHFVTHGAEDFPEHLHFAAAPARVV